MASCNTEPAANADDAQAKIDSMVNERVDQIRMELQAQNDSLINAMAMYRADSIIAARSGKKVAPRPKATPPVGTSTNTNTTTTQESQNPKDSRFGGTTDNTTKKESRFSEEAADKQKEASKDKKADRFK